MEAFAISLAFDVASDQLRGSAARSHEHHEKIKLQVEKERDKRLLMLQEKLKQKDANLLSDGRDFNDDPNKRPAEATRPSGSERAQSSIEREIKIVNDFNNLQKDTEYEVFDLMSTGSSLYAF